MASRSRNVRGFSLLEAMIALGVLSVGGYFLASVIRTGAVGQKTILAQDDARVLTDNMANVLTDSVACANTFGGKDPSMGSPISSIKDKSNGSQFSVGQKYGSGIVLHGVTIGGNGIDAKTQLQLWLPGTTLNSGIAFVRIDWQQSGAKENIQGPAHFFRFFLVQVTAMENGKILSCTAQPGTGGSNYWSMNSNGDIFNNNANGSGSVGVGTNAPVATLDINGTARLLVNPSQPYACDGSHDGALALNSAHQLCVCNGAARGWVLPHDGSTACSFSVAGCVPMGGSCQGSQVCCSGLTCDASAGTCKVPTSGLTLRRVNWTYNPSLPRCSSYGWAETPGSPCDGQGVLCLLAQEEAICQ